MNIPLKCLFYLLAGVTTGCADMSDEIKPTEAGRIYYFAGAELKNYPVKVYGPISADAIASYSNAYYEVLFDVGGRVAVLRKMHHGLEMSKTSYQYYESGMVKEERWTDSTLSIVRAFSSEGRLVREEKTEPVVGIQGNLDSVGSNNPTGRK